MRDEKQFCTVYVSVCNESFDKGTIVTIDLKAMSQQTKLNQAWVRYQEEKIF